MHPSREFPLISLIRWSLVVPAIWLLAKAVGLDLERTHRREFLEDLAIVPTRAALASDSGLTALVREELLRSVPQGSNTLAVKAYARHLGVLNRLTPVSGGLGQPVGYLWLSFPERVRWYEFGVCDWTRGLEFTLDSAGAVRDVSATRHGTCI